MKKAKEKVAFGIFQDGLNIKMAQLAMDSSGAIKVQKLEETVLTYPLYRAEIPTSRKETKKAEILEDDLNIPEISEFEESDGFEEIKKEEEISGKTDLQKLLLNFPVERGKISINASDSQISYYQFDSKFSEGLIKKKGESVFLSKDGRKKLESKIFSKEELKQKHFRDNYNFIINPDKSILAYAHRGEYELLKAIKDINLLLTKKKYFFGCIEPNEISLMNLVRNNYEFGDEEYVLILYIGVDYKVGIVMKGNVHIKTFPIIITDSKPANMRRSIFSKVTLEQDLSHVHFTQNIILAGEYIKDEDVAYFVLKFSYRSKVSRLEFGKDMIPDENDVPDFVQGSEVNAERMARFAIPIALAWKTIDPKNNNFFSTNLIPASILDKQKPFKVEWHGYLLLAGLFYFSLSGTINNLKIEQDITLTKRQIEKTETELKAKNDLARKLVQIKEELKILAEQTERTEKIQGNNNQWNYIIQELTMTVANNPLSWIGRIRSEGDKFRVKGFTTKKRNILNFASLFPNSNIDLIRKTPTDEIVLWEFEIVYPFPERIDNFDDYSKLNNQN